MAQTNMRILELNHTKDKSSSTFSPLRFNGVLHFCLLKICVKMRHNNLSRKNPIIRQKIAVKTFSRIKKYCGQKFLVAKIFCVKKIT